jgi:hypothetical protein
MAKTTPTPGRPRNPVLVTVDILAGIVLIVIGVALSIGVVFTVGQFPALVSECGSAAPGGVPCEAGGLVSTVALIVIAIAVFAAALGLGFFVVRLIQKRLAFYWPLLGIVVTIAALYIGSAIVGAAAG